MIYITNYKTITLWHFSDIKSQSNILYSGFILLKSQIKMYCIEL